MTISASIAILRSKAPAFTKSSWDKVKYLISLLPILENTFRFAIRRCSNLSITQCTYNDKKKDQLISQKEQCADQTQTNADPLPAGDGFFEEDLS